MKSSIQLSTNRYLENISKLYKDEELTDITLWCKDGTIKAHKVVLATCSPYFHKIFIENNRNDNLVLIMHGVSYNNLYNLIELIYKGNIEVTPDNLNSIYELAGEFQISGISGVLHDEDIEISELNNQGGRHTRFKGLKRVAVDFVYNENDKKKLLVESSLNGGGNEETMIKSEKQIEDIGENVITIDEDKTQPEQTQDNQQPPLKLSAWAKKQRKFKCDLCPSSFKRSSHLTRHQLVHTGERPFACNQCDKAFSRHDKLKHHIRKTHEQTPEIQNFDININTVVPPPPSPLPFVISQVCSADNDLFENNLQAKRGRGRPRKYPIVPKPLVKRGRGRPRINPLNTRDIKEENYDITNLPFGDLDYLTMPIRQEDEGSCNVMIEPLVEIKENKDEVSSNGNNVEQLSASSSSSSSSSSNNNDVNLNNINEETTTNNEVNTSPQTFSHENIITKIEKFGEGLTHNNIMTKIAKIGECTISVANN